MKINTHARTPSNGENKSDADDASDDDGHIHFDDKTEPKDDEREKKKNTSNEKQKLKR